MTEKRYEVAMPSDIDSLTSNIVGSVAAIETLMANCEKALAKAEAEKPTAWDFGFTRESSPALALKSRQVKNYYQGWVGGREGRDPWSSSPSAIEHGVHILGNLKEITEQQGPIVVGMTVERAKQVQKACFSWDEDRVAKDIRSALARYKENKP